MPFAPPQRAQLLTVKGVGPQVIKRIEALGITTFAELAHADAHELAEWISEDLGSTCWRNSPLAISALQGAIQLAFEETEKTTAIDK